jgi:hypothetical protein
MANGNPPTTPDQNAAHEFLSELRTRITTQPLPYQHGVEARALESIWEVFAQARAVMKKNVGCQQFAATVTRMLNLDLRPVTAKWHRAKEEGRLLSRDGADEFRADLVALQTKLRAFAVQLHTMAYGQPAQDALTPPAISPAELQGDFASVLFHVDPGTALDPQEAEKIEQLESRDIAKRRQPADPAPAAPANVVGLALSGGGIRSATFCLGVTQVLAERGLLADVDVLSTVSGGGYTGAFLAGRLGEGADQSAVARPGGPDPAAVRRLRLHVKFLASSNLKETWGRVTAALAGLLLNWTAPLFVVASIALAAKVVADAGGDAEDVLAVVKAAAILTGVSLLAYAIAMRVGDRASKWTGRVLGWLCAVAVGAVAVWLAVELPTWFSSLRSANSVTVTVPIVAGLSAIGPMMLRFLPIFKDPAIRNRVLKVLLYVAAVLIPVLGLFAVYVCYWVAGLPLAVGSEWWHPLHYGGFSLLAAAAALAAVVSFLFLNINSTSPHRLYRDGLARTFIDDGKSAARGALKDMNGSGRAPYHLINTALNLPSSKAVALRDRRADFFLMSKHFCGSPATGYVATQQWKVDGRDIDVATAIAISGAAVSPHMGLGAMPTLTALLAFLNVRLGFWLRRPGAAWSARLGMSAPGIFCLFREMTGLGMSERRAWLNVSDGGHIENLGVYELLRRRCKFIICVDAEADPQFMFHGLMTLVRHAQIDFGVRIDTRLNELRADPATGLCKRHTLLCRIHYPNGDIGLLLYLKLSVTGNESELIKRYRGLHPAFPHQSTLDQFFDEEQFEAYRQLGAHVADGLFTPAVTDGKTTPATVAAWFESLAGNLLEPAA